MYILYYTALYFVMFYWALFLSQSYNVKQLSKLIVLLCINKIFIIIIVIIIIFIIIQYCLKLKETRWLYQDSRSVEKVLFRFGLCCPKPYLVKHTCLILSSEYVQWLVSFVVNAAIFKITFRISRSLRAQYLNIGTDRITFYNAWNPYFDKCACLLEE